MLTFTVRRLWRLVLVLLAVYTLVFFAARVIPGGPFEEGELPISAESRGAALEGQSVAHCSRGASA